MVISHGTYQAFTVKENVEYRRKAAECGNILTIQVEISPSLISSCEDIDEWEWRSMLMMNIALCNNKLVTFTTPVNYIIVIVVLHWLFHTCLFIP